VAKTVVVVPNHLPHLDFLKEWDELQNVPLIIVQDNDIKPSIPRDFTDVTVFTHQDVALDLQADAWIIPKRTSACRSYGFYKAWQTGADVILTLDNDCYPERANYWRGEHERNLSATTTLDWVSSCTIPFTRGFPYRIRDASEVVLSHGLWSNVPDLDAPTALQHPDLRLEPAYGTTVVPRWSFFPMCGMNLGWRAELTPALYFGLFGPDYKFDQYDDIWAGVLCKKVMDHLGLAAVTGAPSVDHRKQSDVFENLRKQTPGLEMNENFWRAVQRIRLTQTTVRDAYVELIDRLPNVTEAEPYGWTFRFKRAALTWAGLFQ
jgi:reversibly glycosylated polypeptide/UDP-arabinopyranose mutase